MKNANKIAKTTTSLFLAITMVFGGLTFAIPGVTPDAYAATENLYVSADNKAFDKSFAGPMVIEIVVNDNDIDEVGDLEPDVTLNGENIKLVQGSDGNWYAYFVEVELARLALTNGFSFGDGEVESTVTTVGIAADSDADAVFADADRVIRQPKALSSNGANAVVANTNVDATDEWPLIQAFDFEVDGNVVITYAKGGNPQSITLKYLDDVDDYASLALDRSSYPPAAHVHMTITSLMHNIDPTDEDSWTYNTANGQVYYQVFDETGEATADDTGRGLLTPVSQIGNLHYGDSTVLRVTPNPNDAKSIYTPTPNTDPRHPSNNILVFRNNGDQDTPGNMVTISGTLITQAVTLLETSPNTGIFKNTDDGDQANLQVSQYAPRGYTGIINFPDTDNSIPIKNYPGSIAMDLDGVGGTWNGGEEISVTLDDGDLNRNSLVDQDIALGNMNNQIPTVQIGSPLTLATLTVERTNLGDPEIFSARSTVTAVGASVTFPHTVMSGYNHPTHDADKRFILNVHVEDADGNVRDGHTVTGVGAPVATTGTLTDITDMVNAARAASVPIVVTLVDEAVNDVAVVDIFRFGQSIANIDSAATTRSADAIYRMLLEETGDNTAMYAGTIEYTLLNQLNVRVPSTYTSLATISDEVTIIIPTDQTDEDSVRVDYVDTDGEGILTQIGAQAETPTHSGIVSFDAANYKVADTVTVTLNDPDLNTNSDTTEVYTTVASTTETRGVGAAEQTNPDNTVFDRVGAIRDGDTNANYGRLLDITFDDATWSSYGCGQTPDGLAGTGFILSETTATSGIFTGTFQIPTRYCTSFETNDTPTGKDLEVNYVDYSDASGEYIEVGDSAGIRANTGSVSFDRTVYPVPFHGIAYETAVSGSNLPTDSGRTVLHVRVNDPDYDLSGSGSDQLPTAGTGINLNTILSVTVVRGSQTSDNLILDTANPLEEISPSSGIFELDLPLGATIASAQRGSIPDTAEDRRIRQGDIVTVQYTDTTDASGNTNTVTDSATFDLRNAVLQTDKTAYIIGSDMILTLIEPDFDLDSDETESYPLTLIEWDSDAATLALSQSNNFDPEPSALRETGDSTGIFQVVLEVPATLGATAANQEALERGEKIDLEYVDHGPAGAKYVGDDDQDVELTVYTSNFGATVSLDKKVYTWTDKVFMTVTAPDHNFDSDLIDRIGDTPDDPVKIATRENSINHYILVETGTDTGIFTGEVILTGFAHDSDGDSETGDSGNDGPTQGLLSTTDSTRANPVGPTDGFLEAGDDDGLTVSFEVSDDETVIGSAIIRWNIGEAEWAEASYPASGTGIIRVTDPDMSLNPESVDNFRVDVWSDSDPGGISLTVSETNEATGVFEGKVSFTTTDESSGHRLRVSEGDTVTAEYEDHTLPDPYDRSDDLDVLATAVIGSIVAPLERAPVSNARIVDTQGTELSSVSVDQQVLVSADLKSGQDKDQAYAYLVQIQDADGVTVLLSWITGTLPTGSASSPSQSWTPTAAGEFTATVFVWESIINPTALSASVSTTIQVS